MPPSAAALAHVRVLVVDDHAGNRASLVELVDATLGFRSLGAAASGEEALRRLDDDAADLLLMDVCMPGKGGITVAREVAARQYGPQVILVSGEDRPDIVADPPAHGADAFVRKDTLTPQLLWRTWARLRETVALSTTG